MCNDMHVPGNELLVINLIVVHDTQLLTLKLWHCPADLSTQFEPLERVRVGFKPTISRREVPRGRR